MSNKKIASQKIDKEKDASNLSKNEINKNDDKIKSHQKILDDLKKEKENLNNDKKINIKNNKEKNINIFNYNAKITLIATVIIVLIIVIFKLYVYKEKSINNTKNNNVNTVKIQTNSKKTNTNAKLSDGSVIDDSLKIKELQDDIDDLEKKISYNDEYIKTLEDKIVELENIIEIQKNHLDSSNINKVQILLDIQKDIQSGKSYSYNLSKLETLDMDSAVKDDINILKQYQNNYVNKKIINDDFNKESKIFLNENNMLKNSNSTFAKFLSNFVVVRKINQTDKSSADNFLLELESYLQKDEYSNAINLLESSSKYAKYFTNTLNNLKEYTLLNSTVEKMINNFTNK